MGMLNTDDWLGLGIGTLSTVLSAKAGFDSVNSYYDRADSYEMQADNILKNVERKAAASGITAEGYRRNANEATAAGQHAAIIKGMEGSETISRALAVAAASGGGGISTRTIYDLVNRLAARRAYQMEAARYEGEDAARLLREKADYTDYETKLMRLDSADAAAATRQTAAAARSAGDSAGLAAGMNALSGFGSLLSKYGKPTATSPVPKIPDNATNWLMPEYDQFLLADL
jgi:hypothetical protein